MTPPKSPRSRKTAPAKPRPQEQTAVPEPQDRFFVLNFMPVGVFALDQDFRILFWNKCLATWTGRPAEEMLGRDIREPYPHLGEPKYASRLEVVFKGGPPAIFSPQLHGRIIPFLLRDGSTPLQHVTVSALRRGQGQVYDALFTIQDVTEVHKRLGDSSAMRDMALKELAERRAAEEALQAKTAILEATMENMGQGIFMADAKGRVMVHNRRLVEILGLEDDFFVKYKTMESQADIWADRFDYPPERRARIKQDIHALTSLTIEFKARDKVVEMRQHPMADGGLVRVYTDITERKNLERLREDVDRLTRHDLKSPLNGILIFPQLLLKADNLTKDQREMLGLIIDAGYQILKMINLSLDLYKMEIGNYRLKPRPVDLVPVLRKILTDFQNLIVTKMLSVHLRIEGRLVTGNETFTVMAEEMLSYSMLANLVKNAVEASPQGERIVIDMDATGEHHTVAITNKGVVPAAIRERFFEKYVTQGKKSGTGLGTYSSRLIAETHGGSIAMDTSDLAGTTTLTVCLPR
jgi:PAS domain S-box-containing protein